MTLEDDLEAAVAELRAGRPVVIPTDTVYGVAALPGVPGAIEAVFAAKGRAEDKPLPVLAASIEDLEPLVALDDTARRLAEAYWPGPLTLVVPRLPGLRWRLGSGEGATIAVRIPDCDLALGLLARSGPLAVTSANLSGDPPATTVEEARAGLGERVRLYLDGGRRAGPVSSVVSIGTTPRLLREGAIAAPDIHRVLPSGVRPSQTPS
jgi:L-threonylcarbamoyladenylate synthase